MCQHALEINRKIFGDEHPITAATLSRNLEQMYQALGKNSEPSIWLANRWRSAVSNLDAFASIESERQQFIMQSHTRGYLDRFLSLVAKSSASTQKSFTNPYLAWKGATFARQRWMRAPERSLSQKQGRRRSLRAVGIQVARAGKRIRSASAGNVSAVLTGRSRTDLSGEVESLQKQLSELTSEFRAAHEARRCSLDGPRARSPRWYGFDRFFSIQRSRLS